MMAYILYRNLKKIDVLDVIRWIAEGWKLGSTNYDCTITEKNS